MKDKTKTQEKSHIFLATDSEWDNNIPGKWISTAFSCKWGTIIFHNPEIPEETKERLYAEAAKQRVTLLFRPRCDQTILVLDVIKRLKIAEDIIYLLFFYSPKDIEYACGWDAFFDSIIQNRVTKRGSAISGKVLLPNDRKIILKDLKGWQPKGSLLKLANSLGVKATDKGAMDDYKSHMQDGLLNEPETFLRYEVGDVKMLRKIHRKYINNIRTLQKDCLNMNDNELLNSMTIPATQGAVVAKIMETWITNQADDPDVFKFCLRKVGILDPDNRNHKKNEIAMQYCINNYNSVEEVRSGLLNSDTKLKTLLRAKFMVTAMEACSVNWFASRPPDDSAKFNALVQGGRCHRENHTVNRVEKGADIDISGCYGNALKQLAFSIGIPTVWSNGPNKTEMNLGRFLAKHEENLVDGQWFATVSGKLTFEQDLISSKMVKNDRIRNGKQTNTEFTVLRKEIKNGIITAEVLDAIRKTATKREITQFMNLDLVTAVAYLKKDRCDSIEQWCEEISKSKPEYLPNVKDTRSRAWVPIPMANFIGQLTEQRKECKARAKDKNLSATERNEANAVSNMLNSIVTTSYGVTASAFFKISNTCLANNITAKGRLAVWMMAKALGLKQTITDGGVYDPEGVHFFRDRAPGFVALSKPEMWHAPKDRRLIAPMEGLDEWDGEDLTTLDKLAMAHVNEFWSRYDVKFPFPQLEHKSVFGVAALWSKGDYGLLPVGGEKKDIDYKIRGKDRRSKDHPSFEIVSNIIYDDDTFPDDLSYTVNGIVSINQFKQSENFNGFENFKGLRPGDDYCFERIARYNNTAMPVDDAKEYLKRAERRTTQNGKKIQFFEKFREQGIEVVLQKMTADKLR